MKKSLLAVAVAAALPAFAQAQSSVTLYGILDANVEYSNDDANTSIAANGTVTAGDATIRVGSGLHSGSRFGVRGTEDLGGGLKAVFTLESGLSTDTGTTTGGGFAAGNGAFWNRQIFVGLQGGWGQLTLGRQYSPIFWAMLPSDFTGYAFYNNWAGISGAGSVPNGTAIFGNVQGPFRIDNSIAYKSPTFGGVTIYAMYAPGELTNSLATNGAGGASGDLMGIALGWQLGGLYASLGYHSIDTNAAGGLETVLAASLTYKFTSFGLSVGYTNQEFIGGGELQNIMGSLFFNIGAGTLYGNVISTDVSGFAGTRNDSGLSFGIAYAYPLSKRTNWYVALGSSDLSGFQPVSATQIDSAQRLAVGIRHLF